MDDHTDDAGKYQDAGEEMCGERTGCQRLARTREVELSRYTHSTTSLGSLDVHSAGRVEFEGTKYTPFEDTERC